PVLGADRGTADATVFYGDKVRDRRQLRNTIDNFLGRYLPSRFNVIEQVKRFVNHGRYRATAANQSDTFHKPTTTSHQIHRNAEAINFISTERDALSPVSL